MEILSANLIAWSFSQKRPRHLEVESFSIKTNISSCGDEMEYQAVCIMIHPASCGAALPAADRVPRHRKAG